MAQRAAERLAGASAVVAVVVPSLSLTAQTVVSWRENAQRPLSQILAVCSDETVADAPTHLADVDADVTTDPRRILDWLGSTGPGINLIVSTYLSADRLAEAVRTHGHPLDILVLDEAHHLTGRPDFAIRRIVEPRWLPARRRLYLTATPRIDVRGDRSTTSGLSMDDTTTFGPVFYSYPFARAIAEGHLEDYRIAVIGVADSRARQLLADVRTEYVDQVGAPSLQTIVAQAALALARDRFGVRRAISFHARVDHAAEFARTLGDTLRRLPDGARHLPGLTARHVHGKMDSTTRSRVLDHLRNPADGGWSAISNARCLGEGVDVPAVDAILFAHPKSSAVDIIQAVGRSLRRHPDTPGPSTIIVPLIVPDGDGEIGDLDAGDYTTLWRVVRALRAHDEPLGAALDLTRPSEPGRTPVLPEKITVVLPDGTSEDILARMSLLLVRQTTSPWWEGYSRAAEYHQAHGHLMIPNSFRTPDGYGLGSWLADVRHERRKGWLPADRVAAMEKLGIEWEPTRAQWQAVLDDMRDHHARHGRLPTQEGDFDGRRSGMKYPQVWLTDQRAAYWGGKLDAAAVNALEQLGIEWEDKPTRMWRQGIAAAQRYAVEHGDLRVPKGWKTPDGYALGAWVHTQRGKYRAGNLGTEQVKALEQLGIVWDPREEKFTQGLTAARDYHSEHGDLRVPQRHTTSDGYKLGVWIAEQRRNRAEQKPSLTPDRIAALDALGMEWATQAT